MSTLEVTSKEVNNRLRHHWQVIPPKKVSRRNTGEITKKYRLNHVHLEKQWRLLALPGKDKNDQTHCCILFWQCNFRFFNHNGRKASTKYRNVAEMGDIYTETNITVRQQNVICFISTINRHIKNNIHGREYSCRHSSDINSRLQLKPWQLQ